MVGGGLPVIIKFVGHLFSFHGHGFVSFHPDVWQSWTGDVSIPPHHCQSPRWKSGCHGRWQRKQLPTESLLPTLTRFHELVFSVSLGYQVSLDVIWRQSDVRCHLRCQFTWRNWRNCGKCNSILTFKFCVYSLRPHTPVAYSLRFHLYIYIYIHTYM